MASTSVTSDAEPRVTLRLVQDADGSIRALEPASLYFDAIQREFAGRHQRWLELIEWVDACPARFGFSEAVDYHGLSLWSFARLWLVTALVRGLPDLQAVAEALRRTRANRLVLTGADEYWAQVCEAALGNGRVTGSVRRRHRSIGAWGATAGRGAVRALRLGAAVARTVRHRQPGGATVLALGYSIWRRVNGPAGPRYMDPAYTPILDELRGRRVPHARLSMPSVSPWPVEAMWLRHGDRDEIPIELTWGLWWAGAGGFRARRESKELRKRLLAAATRAREASVPWQGVDAGPLAGALVADSLLHRLPQGLGRMRFFEHLLGTMRPQSLLLTSEYNGAALAATIAARRLGIPSVAVQHGVIWPGHPGYVAGAGAHGWLARPDVVCVYGDYERRLLTQSGGFRPEQVVVTGAPRLDLVAVRTAAVELRQRLLETLKLPSELPLVLFTSSGPMSGAVARRLIDLLSQSTRPVSVVVKVHPSAEDEPEIYAALAREAGYEPFRVVGEEFDLYDLLRAVDVHVSTNSTVLTEACVFERPNLMVCGDLFADTVGYIERGVAVAAEPYGSLQAAVDAVLHGPVAERLSAGRKAFVAEQFFRLDGLASSRIVDVLLSVASGSPRSAAS